MKLLWVLIVFISGAFLPIQAGLNGKLGKAIESPVYASMISFIVGSLSLVVYIILTKQTVSLAGIRLEPAYIWLGGVLGAFYVTAILFSFPRLGLPLTFGLIVAGQMLTSVLMDHLNILVEHKHTANIWRIFGMLLIISGVIIIRKF